jgi:hypothetical protein
MVGEFIRSLLNLRCSEFEREEVQFRTHLHAFGQGVYVAVDSDY